MFGKRVVITGAGAVSPFGLGAELLTSEIHAGHCGIGIMPGHEEVAELGASVAAVVPEIDLKAIPRQQRRSMSKMAAYAYLAAHEALENAGLAKYPLEMGVSLGTTMGSPDTLTEFFTEYLGHNKGFGNLRSTTFFKIMGHGAASSLALALGLNGPTLAPSAACAAGLQAIGLGARAISAGEADLMLCGGTEEFNVLTALTFDHIMAASHNPDPLAASRPFDINRDGLVCGEGAGLVLLESEEHAKKRGAAILGEIVGFATSTSPASLAHPDLEGIKLCMERALADSGLEPGDIDLVNAHATSTIEGDRVEAAAIGGIFGSQTPVVSFKSQLGHTMAASGALELIICLWMMRNNIILPNINLSEPDLESSHLRLPRESGQGIMEVILKNSLALGGVNATLLIKKYC